MKKSCDVPKADCLDVCHLIPGMTGEPWDEVPITLLAYAGYYGRQDMIDYLIQEGASKKGYNMFCVIWKYLQSQLTDLVVGANKKASVLTNLEHVQIV